MLKRRTFGWIAGTTIAAVLAWPSAAWAQNAFPTPGGSNANGAVNMCPSAASSALMVPCDSANPLAVNATVSASIGGWPGTSQTTGTPIAVTTGGATGTLPAGTVVVATNVGATNIAYCKLGASATTSDVPIFPNSAVAFTVGSATQLSCITSTSTTTVNMAGGAGLPTGWGGGGSGGSGGSSSIITWAGGTLGAMANYGTSPGAVLVPGVNASVTNTVTVGGVWQGATGSAVPANSTYTGINVAGNLRGMTGLALGSTFSPTVAIVDASGAQIAPSVFGSAFPATGTAVGFSDGTSMRAATGRSLGSTFSQTVAIVDASGNQITSFGGTSPAIGPVAPGTAASNSQLSGCVYSASGITLTDTQQAACQVNASGSLEVVVTNASIGQNVMAASSPVVIASDQRVADRCMYQDKTNLAINQNSTSSVQLVALSGSTVIYICSIFLMTNSTATTVAFTTGTGTACATGNAAVIGSTTANIANSINLIAGAGFTLGNGQGTIAKGAAASELCMILGSNVYVSGNLTYVQQ